MDVSEHLQELRARLIRALIGIGIALIFCLLNQDEIMWIVTGPHRRAMAHMRSEIAKNEQQSKEGEPTEAETFRAGLEKLKAGNPEQAQLLEMLDKRLSVFEEHVESREGTLQAIKYQEAFISYLKVSIIAAIILASPWILLQIWGFVAAGLYKRERRYVTLYLPFSFVAFAAGVTFGYFILIPEGLKYLATYANPGLVSMHVTLGYYLSLFLILTVLLGFVFQLPLVMLFLTRADIVTTRQFAKYRRYALLLAVILGAVFTPPDPVTQILLASPMFMLYELGIWLSRIAAKRAKKETA
jgi:sec-independent protein translocase protein TatC